MPELTLAHPERLWWLLVLPLLLLLLLPPRPRRVAYTAHLPQWRAAMQGLRRRPPRALSLRALLLLLAAGAALAAVLGVSLAGRPGPQRLVVLLDGSLSMAAHDAYAEASRELRARLAGLPESVDVRVLRCGGPLLRRHGASARSLHDLGGPAGSRDVDLAALAAAAGGEDTAVWTLTDGQGTGELPAAGALSLFGQPAANAAVLALRLVDRWPLPGLDVEADVIAFAGGEELAATVRVTGAVEAQPARAVALRSGEPATLRWSLLREPAGGALAVEIDLAGDALAADDRGAVLLPPLPAPRIAALTDAEAGPFAAVAAEALAAEVRGEVVAATSGAEVGLLLVDGGEVALAPGEARALCFGARFLGGGPAGAGQRPGALDWDRTGPLTAGLDLSELRIDRVFPATLPPGEPFLFGEAGGERVPLAVVAGGGTETASVHFAFRLQDGNLPLLAAFPQLLRRAFVQSHGAAARAQPLTAEPPAGEQDLWRRRAAEDRPLPEFGTPDAGLGPWLMLAGVAFLLLRLFVRR